ncbi:MAG: hypothetical protein DLM72_13595 [Candidatus Nitrosopolaris wilkensis]|nr:MAG: hypothetical protein DLM72_13595 [Candidatus Nitrosopolaris wilkensis]
MADMTLSKEDKVEIETRFEEHVGQMIRLGSSFGRNVSESAKSADLLLHIHFYLARLTSDLREEKIVNHGNEESRKRFIKEYEECEGELKQIATMVYAKYGVTGVG